MTTSGAEHTTPAKRGHHATKATQLSKDAGANP
jgi:hypothetical protein